MFGTISHARVKPGHEGDLEKLEQEWTETIRPKIPGSVMWLRGHPKEHPDQIVEVFLCRDASTYTKLADSPEMDALFQRMREHYQADPTWEDVQIDTVYQD